jgi:hypothetical protein
MEIELEDGTRAPIGSEADLPAHLDRLSADGPTFAILSRSPDHYVQALRDEAGFVVEMQTGGTGRHFSAARLGPQPAPRAAGKWWQFWKQAEEDRFEADEVLAIFAAFLAGGPMPDFTKWVKVELPPS